MNVHTSNERPAISTVTRKLVSTELMKATINRKAPVKDMKMRTSSMRTQRGNKDKMCTLSALAFSSRNCVWCGSSRGGRLMILACSVQQKVLTISGEMAAALAAVVVVAPAVVAPTRADDIVLVVVMASLGEAKKICDGEVMTSQALASSWATCVHPSPSLCLFPSLYWSVLSRLVVNWVSCVSPVSRVRLVTCIS